MEELYKILAKAELALTAVLAGRFGMYKRRIDFLKDYLSQEKSSVGKNMVKMIAAAYAVVILAGAGVYLVYYMQIRGLNAETAIIEPNINREEENRLNAELAVAMAAIDEYNELHGLFDIDEALYNTAYFINVDELGIIYNTADLLGITVRSVSYDRENSTVVLDCFAFGQFAPYEYIKSLRELLPNAEIEYTGYSRERGEVFGFSVVCRFTIESTDDSEDNGEGG